MTNPHLPSTFTLTPNVLHRKRLTRIYWAGQDPLNSSFAKTNRYDCPILRSTPYGVLYLGFDVDTCWMETVTRNLMVRDAGSSIGIPLNKMENRWACDVEFSEPLHLAYFGDDPLIHLGESASNVMGDGYERTMSWSNLIYEHANPKVDGIYYRSRFNSGEFCIALFDRAIKPCGLKAENKRSMNPLTSTEAQSIMRRYNIVPT